mmetsp:Transcript_11482/g.21967  ORF Transcript_11482/g.21967 Transcript_11482/m.21967 type:complete len:519 (-) Transcript_11482:136-1692(-)
MPPNIDFSQTAKSLEQFVTEIGSVEAMMRGRLMDLVRALEAQNREDKTHLSETSHRYKQLMMQYEKLQKEHSSVESRYNFSVSLSYDQLAKRYEQLEEEHKNLQRHCSDLEMENQTMRVEYRQVMMEREIMRRRVNTALQFSQLPRAAGNALAGAPSHISKQDLDQVVGTDMAGVLRRENGQVDIAPKPQELANGSPMGQERMEALKRIALGTGPFTFHKERDNDDKRPFYLYCCPIEKCRDTFPFPKELDPPRDATGKISDKEKWDEKRFPMQIEIIQQHMKKRHASVPEALWPPGFAKRSRPNPVDEQGNYFWYTCPAKDCGMKFAFDTHSKPPLDKNGQVLDTVAWDERIFGDKIQGIHSHIKTAHPGFPEDQWPVAISPTRQNGESSPGYHRYNCPIEGCVQIFEIAKKFQPPLDAEGKVSDSLKWDATRLDPVMTTITRHLQSKHPKVPYTEWPPALAPESVDTESEASDDDDDDDNVNNDDDGSAASHSSGEEKQADNHEDNKDEDEGVLVI